MSDEVTCLQGAGSLGEPLADDLIQQRGLVGVGVVEDPSNHQLQPKVVRRNPGHDVPVELPHEHVVRGLPGWFGNDEHQDRPMESLGGLQRRQRAIRVFGRLGLPKWEKDGPGLLESRAGDEAGTTNLRDSALNLREST